MKVVSYTALLYGTDYLGYAIRSIIDHVAEHHIIYSPVGAHGSRTDLPCPETRDELYAIAEHAAGGKLRWHDAGPFLHEGYQRESIHQYAPDADVILVLDADEIWPEGMAEHAVDRAKQYPPVRNWLGPIQHYWRSFYRCILHDPAYPVRMILPKGTITDRPSLIDFRRWEHPDDMNVFTGKINHMGYAQRSEIVEFKLLTHGHRNEFRRDCDWFRDRFMANVQHDCHPVGSVFWRPEEINPWDYLPGWMRLHPYANLEVIP